MKLASFLFKECLETNRFKKLILFSMFCLFMAQAGLSQQRVSGTVTDEQGIPIAGAAVLEKNTTNGTATDFDGNFEITTIGPDPILVFSYLGFVAQEVPVQGGTVNVELKEDLQQLSEVVVIGYGTQKREEVTTAIATVKSEDFNPGFVRDAADLVKGKVAGLNISNGSGDPSATSFMSLRGISSLQGNAQPLVLINGLPGDLNSVSPGEIESIDVLKDASAAAIYGTRGANGVILITTKSGKRNMAPTLSYSHYTSMSSFGKTADFLDANDARKLMAEGETLPFGDDLGYTTDWLKEISRTAVTQNHNLNFSGGNESSTYSVNVNYTDQEGVFKKSFNEEFRISADVNHYMFDGLLKLNANIINGLQNTGALGDGNAFDNRIYRQALIRNPTDRIRDDEGNFIQDGSKLQYVNPVGMIELTDGVIQNRWMRLTGNVTLTPLEGWENNIMVATERRNGLTGYTEKKEYLGYNGERRNGFASRGTEQTKTNLMEITSKYTKSLDKHNFSVLGGYSYQYFDREGFWANNRDFPTDAFSYHNLEVGQGLIDGTARMDSYRDDNRLIGFFGRVSYGFDSRYNLLASFRREGSSKFGANNKWGNFPAISAGWTISNESFMDGIGFVDNLKLRAGYGETGVIPNNSYLSLTLLDYAGRFYSNGEWVRGLEAQNNPNPDLQWEVSKEINLGLDFAFANNRIDGSVDFYRKKTEGMLWNYSVPTPPNLSSTTLANVGEMENKGFEILLNVTPIKTNDFSWESNITLSHNKNELLSLSNDLYEIEGDYVNFFTLSEPVSQVTHRLEVGQPVGNFWGLRSVDVDLVEARDNFDEGYFWTIELPDGSLVPWSNELDSDENKQYLGNGYPAYVAGITNTFRYKNFDLSFVLNGAFDFQIINAQRVFYEYPHIQYNVLNSAFGPVYGKDVTLSNQIGQTFVSYYVEDGDYVKLDNVTLGYNFNVDRLNFIKSLRVYVTGNNLAIFTNYSGIDPEIRRDGGNILFQGTDDRDKYPTVRTFTLGLNVNL
ncbi:SusC/RagA family TonB-linked outer membrane protein [Flagellimonas baculiformis]|uniref:SusC/RagA family TonB-linked outer membrane protein n=1 Tax=Flagellimonas baculiformis TaxID=3067310 RepID=UPI00296F486E|nr:TonB-dependent receptor [Muricauda sp. D6]